MANYRYFKRVQDLNRSFKECICSVDTEQAIEKLTQPKRIRKSKALLSVHNRVAKTGKPVCTSMGIHNPAKLNISIDTLNKLKNSWQIVFYML